MDNPIREIRHRKKLTLEEFAEVCGVHLQAVYLNERGCYPHILPSIRDYLASEGFEVRELDEQYAAYQARVRLEFGESVNASDYSIGPPTRIHPFQQFRADLGQSRMGIAKVLAIHPAFLYRLERGEARGLSFQVKGALRDAGFHEWVIGELDFRCSEFANGDWNQSPERTAG